MKEQIKKYLNHAYKGLGDIVVSATIKHQTGSEFNDATGMLEETYENYPVDLLIYEFDRFEILHTLISPGDFKVLLQADQIDFVPKPADDVILIEDKQYSIESVTDKNGVMYILTI